MIGLPPNDLCYICGVRSANTKDHLFPECLFQRPMPSNLPKRLPACRECNNGLSKDEELFRVFMASGMAYENDAGYRIWTERIRPDLQGDRPGLKPLLQSLVKQYLVFSKTGEFLGQVIFLEKDRDFIHRILSKIARGLYFLPPLDEAFKGAKKFDYGNGAVTYWRNTMKDDPTASLTWLRFFEDKWFLICTFRQEIL